MTPSTTTVVVPTVGRPTLAVFFSALARQSRRVSAPVILVDDRPSGPDLAQWLVQEVPHHGLDVRVLRAGGGGPARARNIGWRHSRSRWVSFLDDDVVPDRDWYETLADDLARAETRDCVGSTGRVRVPLSGHRPPTDWERGTAGLETSRWITADLSYRRDALSEVGGFDERFPRAFREDADLALRLGGERRILDGARWITHPVRPADDWVSLRQQAGNADDFLMRAVHGRDWHRRADAPVGRRPRHLAVSAAAVLALAGLVARRRALALAGLAAWTAGTVELAWARIAPGPRDADEVRRMVLTSAAIPLAATYHAARGALRHRGARPWRGLPELVLLDRDGTLVHDVPYNGDPARVRPVDGVRESLDRLRAEGVRLAVVTNQSGVASGRLTREQVDAVNARVEELLGPFDVVEVCPHGPTDGCGCRKPAPGMLKRACEETGVDPGRAVMIGDIGADVEAAAAAGVSAVLVPTASTRAEEVAAAYRVAPSFATAVSSVMAGEW
ncbi:HAD-IIIA family hydrolase [Nocardioides sp. cx-169]|uniref:HAD-IIIA family hydrolase n=1 Tax=Nocardioides sp. cx-169 TaxID=2899080 RepID=UPI001E2E5BB1|nr:HAD-IIIA family hydrolase [Nocardioides sp. cx-169]MCD4532567.1 HAD-IIIA family hydrolase [Nocardioides sp. cx-169]